jgi:NitT/TauT family transport system substrate-binding protein
MFDRRRLLQAAAAIGSVVLAPRAPSAEGKAAVTVRYSEVVHSILYTPAYVAMAKGLFADAGIDVSMTTAQGGDKVIAALLGGSADIILTGPEAAIYVHNSESPTKARIFCGLTAADGFMLIGREKIDVFNWSMLKGKKILGWREGSSPLLFFEAALRLNGLDPAKDVMLVNNVAIPAHMGAWLANQTDFAIFDEPRASQLILDGNAHFVASIGQTVGPVDYTTFMATDRYIHDNPEIIQNWSNAIFKAQRWTAAAQTREIVDVLLPFFPGVSAAAMTAGVDRYRALKIWKSNPMLDPALMDKFQDVLVQGNVLDNAKRVKFADLVVTEFAAKAQ